MNKEDKQIIDRAIKENWRIGDRTRLKRLLKKNLELYRENVELEKENEEMKKGLGCETCQIHLEYMGLNDKINNLEKENKLLGERCNQLLKDKGDLTDKCRGLEKELIKKADTNHSLVEQMADIESKNAELKEKVKGCYFGKDEFGKDFFAKCDCVDCQKRTLALLDLRKEYLNKTNEVNELQKKNAELKAQLDAIDKAGEHVRQQITEAFRNKRPYWELEKENAELKETIRLMNEQQTK